MFLRNVDVFTKYLIGKALKADYLCFQTVEIEIVLLIGNDEVLPLQE